jgi:hypothetical protein
MFSQSRSDVPRFALKANKREVYEDLFMLRALNSELIGGTKLSSRGWPMSPVLKSLQIVDKERSYEKGQT